jgi:hypothetical protein
MPAVFAVGDVVLGNPVIALFAGFGSFALLILVGFGGSLQDRVRSQAALVGGGAALVCLGTLASHSTLLATARWRSRASASCSRGVVSSVLAAATVPLLLSFILPVSLSAPASEIPDRLAGWGIAGAASLVAIVALWPAPDTDRLRSATAAACAAHARRLRAEAASLLAATAADEAERDSAVEAAEATTATMRSGFLRTPYQPGGLGTAARALVRLVDEVGWLQALAAGPAPGAHVAAPESPVLAVKLAAAATLELAAEDCSDRERPPTSRCATRGRR